jgi:hypothetical protein
MFLTLVLVKLNTIWNYRYWGSEKIKLFNAFKSMTTELRNWFKYNTEYRLSTQQL